MNAPATTRLVPTERLSAISSLISEGAEFDGNFQTNRDQGIKVDGRLRGNITFEVGGTVHVGATGVIGDASYDELIDMHPRARVRGKVEYRGDIDAAQS
jgi:cytoskeletal protein CcmA (bactofilin family)